MAKITSVEKTTLMEQPIGSVRRFNLRLIHWVTLLLLLALVGAGLSLVLYTNSQKQLKDVQKQLADFKKDPNSVAKQEITDLVNKVGQLVVLPSDEAPTIATVTDLSKLQDQPFFANAQVGDKVLIYTNAKKAILYRPSSNKVIEIAPLNLGAQSGSGTSSQTVTIAVLNGSGTVGLGKQVSDKLTAAGLTVSRVADAPSSAQTVIQYKTGKDVEAAIANQTLGGQAVLKSSSSIKEDIVVTIGKNFSP